MAPSDAPMGCHSCSKCATFFRTDCPSGFTLDGTASPTGERERGKERQMNGRKDEITEVGRMKGRTDEWKWKGGQTEGGVEGRKQGRTYGRTADWEMHHGDAQNYCSRQYTCTIDTYGLLHSLARTSGYAAVATEH